MDDPLYGRSGRLPRLVASGLLAAGVTFQLAAVAVGLVIGLRHSPALTAVSGATLGQLAAALTLAHWCQRDILDSSFRGLAVALAVTSTLQAASLFPLAVTVQGPQGVCAAQGADRVCIDRRDPLYCRGPAPPDCYWEYGTCTVSGRCGAITAVGRRVTVLDGEEALNYTCTVPTRLPVGGGGP